MFLYFRNKIFIRLSIYWIVKHCIPCSFFWDSFKYILHFFLSYGSVIWISIFQFEREKCKRLTLGFESDNPFCSRRVASTKHRPQQEENCVEGMNWEVQKQAGRQKRMMSLPKNVIWLLCMIHQSKQGDEVFIVWEKWGPFHFLSRNYPYILWSIFERCAAPSLNIRLSHHKHSACLMSHVSRMIIDNLFLGHSQGKSRHSYLNKQH